MTIANQKTSTPEQTSRPDRVSGLYVGLTYEDWQDLTQWLPMMRISWDDDGNYYHSFTRAFQDNYELVKGNVLNPKHGYSQTWKNKRIYGIFDGRIPRRADSLESYSLYGVEKHKGDFISLFARNGGKRHGDRYDVFPEVAPNEAGEYEFWFRIYGLPSLIRQGHKEVKAIADRLQPQQKLTLKVEFKETKVYYNDIHMGYCPHYIHYFLTRYPDSKYEITVDIVNYDEYCYEDRIIAKFILSSEKPIYSCSDLRPINSMPV